jgi:hypothetical protein
MKSWAKVTHAVSSQRPRIVVADDSMAAREGIAAIIRRELRYPVCGLAKDSKTTHEADATAQQRFEKGLRAEGTTPSRSEALSVDCCIRFAARRK